MNRSYRSVVVSCCLVSLVLSPLALRSQTSSPVAETGRFRLHKFEQPIGEETYTITHDGSTLTLKSEFLLYGPRNKGSALRHTEDGGRLHAAELHHQGQYFEDVRNRFRRRASAAQTQRSVRPKKRTRAPRRRVFSPSPAMRLSLIQMALVRYWRAHGSPAQLTMLPTGEVKIQDRGAETIEVDGRGLQLERYTVRGLIWGMETLWMDGKDNLAALVSTDAEFDHFEAVREEYEPALAKFVASAARDQMASLSELSQGTSGRRTGTLAFVGATVINSTGEPPMSNATIVIRDAKIIAVGPGNKVKVPSDAQRVDVTGKFIIPGLWDMHAHYEQVEWGPIYLAAGVTTVRDVGNEFEFITAVRDAVNSGKGLGPHMLLAGIVDGDSSVCARGRARELSSRRTDVGAALP